MKKVELKDVNPFFDEINNEWMQLMAQGGDKINSMTISWGGIGIMWHKPVVYTVIRPQRYTKILVDDAKTFSLSLLDDSVRDKHKYFGTVSGHKEDKIAASGLQIEYSNDTPYFKASKRVFICRKMFAQAYDPKSFLDSKHIMPLYTPLKDYHTLYISEILEVLDKE